MKPIDVQLSFEDVNSEYKAFVEKFKPKKTTDDCYTPENVYEAIKDWVCKEYGVSPENVVRPFWPGGNYEKYPYKETDVVIDNPPFSIIGQIVKFYNNYEIPYFLFSPYLTNFTGGMHVSHLITGQGIVYENGADVATGFLTNMDEYLIRSLPDLAQIIKAENDKNLKAIRKQVPKYSYPDEVITATAIGYLAQHGVELKIQKEDCYFIRQLDSQKHRDKSLFGGGFLLSERAAAERAAAERAAAERAAAERAAAERAAAERWTLSDREWEIVRNLGKRG